LKELWKDVVKSIEKLSEAGCYERVNKFMSFFTVDYLRKRLIDNVDGEIVIDAGSGPGNLSVVICENISRLKKLILIDPSRPMIFQALKTLKRRCSYKRVSLIGISGVFEYIPLRDSSVDSIVSSFAFRDAIDYGKAISEFWRVLKPDGTLGILDLYRPSRDFLSLAVKVYLAIVPSLGALVLGCPRMTKAYWLLKKTVEKMLTETQLIEMLKKRFRTVRFKSFYPGVGLWIATSKRS